MHTHKDRQKTSDGSGCLTCWYEPKCEEHKFHTEPFVTAGWLTANCTKHTHRDIFHDHNISANVMQRVHLSTCYFIKWMSQSDKSVFRFTNGSSLNLLLNNKMLLYRK